MNYEDLFQQAMTGSAEALETMNELAAAGNEEVQYLLSCVYDNPDSPFEDVNLGMHWLKTSAGYEYEPAKKKMKELPSDIKIKYGLEPESDSASEGNGSNSDSIFSFKGRTGRTNYFILMLIYVVGIGIILAMLEPIASDAGDPFWLALLVIIHIIRLYLVVAVVVRRLHDCGYSGWWALVPVTPAVVLFASGEEKDNEYGPKRV